MSSQRPMPLPECVVRPLAGGWHHEHRHGYRFSPELEELPGFVPPSALAGRVVELGSGNGALLLAALSRAAAGPPALGLERQPALVRLAQANLGLRRPAREIGFILADIRELPCTDSWADCVLLNPPFFPPGWGRESSLPERHLSTHEVAGGLTEFLGAAAGLLRAGGQAYVIYGPERLAELCGSAAQVGLRPIRLRLIRHLTRGTVARLFVELRKPLRSDHGSPGLYVDEISFDFSNARS